MFFRLENMHLAAISAGKLNDPQIVGAVEILLQPIVPFHPDIQIAINGPGFIPQLHLVGEKQNLLLFDQRYGENLDVKKRALIQDAAIGIGIKILRILRAGRYGPDGVFTADEGQGEKQENGTESFPVFHMLLVFGPK